MLAGRFPRKSRRLLIVVIPTRGARHPLPQNRSPRETTWGQIAPRMMPSVATTTISSLKGHTTQISPEGLMVEPVTGPREPRSAKTTTVRNRPSIRSAKHCQAIPECLGHNQALATPKSAMPFGKCRSRATSRHARRIHIEEIRRRRECLRRVRVELDSQRSPHRSQPRSSKSSSFDGPAESPARSATQRAASVDHCHDRLSIIETTTSEFSVRLERRSPKAARRQILRTVGGPSGDAART